MLLLLLDRLCVQRSFVWARDRRMCVRLPLAIALAVAGIALGVWGERTFARRGHGDYAGVADQQGSSSPADRSDSRAIRCIPGLS